MRQWGTRPSDDMNGTGDKLTPATSSDAEVEAFLNKVATVSRTAAPAQRGRLLFAIDATASREPTWDMACAIQSEMFASTQALGGLEVQLAFYRGFGEMKVTRWLGGPRELVSRMTKVRCLAGRTQIRKVLRHALKESRRKKVNALVFVGDVIEEDIDELGHLAGELGLIGTPVFVFHEGGEEISRSGFQQIARLSHGAYCAFDAGSAAQLSELLKAVAVYSAGGQVALEDYSHRTGGKALQITHQILGKD